MRKLLKEICLNVSDRAIIWLFMRTLDYRTSREIAAFFHFMEAIDLPVTIASLDGKEISIAEALQSRD
jgi:hypothetical protein